MTWRMFDSDGYAASASIVTRTRTTTSSTAVTPAWPVSFARVRVVSFMASPAPRLLPPGNSTARDQLVWTPGEGGHPVAAGPLRLVQGLVSRPDDLVRVPAVPGEPRQPDAHRDRVQA